MATSHSNSSLSSPQKRIWFECQNGNTLQNHVALVYELNGEFSPAIMQQALSQLVAEHDIFRTTIFSTSKSLERFVHEQIKVDLKCLSLEPNSDIYPTIKHIIDKPFNLSTGPLFRFVLLQKDLRQHIFVVVFHRLIVNACVLKKIVREISHHYQTIFDQKVSLVEPKISFETIVTYEKNYRETTHYRETIRHWSNRVKDKNFYIDLSKLPETEGNLTQVRSQRITLDHAIHHKITDFCARFPCSPEQVFLSVLQTLLYRYSDNADIVVNRPEEITYEERWQDLIGPTGNILPWNIRIHPSTTFLTLLTQNQQCDTYKKYYPNAHVADIVRTVRNRFNHHFDGFFSNVSFEQESIPFHEFILPGVTIRALPQYIHRTRQEELQVCFDEHNQHFYLSFDYAEKFSSTAIHQFTEHYQTLLHSFLSNPEQLIFNVNFLSITEKNTLLQTILPLPSDNHSIVTLFEHTVENFPNHVAVIDEYTSLTYSELNKVSNQLAHALKAQGIKPNDYVGLAVGRNIGIVIATLGVLKARAAYVPLDPSYPQERLTHMMQDANVSLVITEKCFEPFIQSCQSVKTLLLDKDSSRELQAYSGNNLLEKPTPEDIAYVIYTSGSTGKPKGVLVPHRGLPNLAQYQNKLFHIQTGMRCLQTGSINFDITALELYGPLITGATIYIASQDKRLAPLKLQEYIIQHHIQIIAITPSVLSQFDWKSMPDLLTIASGGEACDQKLMDFWAHGRRFINAYGPTEITIASHFKLYESNTLSNNLGQPLPLVEAYILDTHKNLLPNGVPGELYIGGIGVAKGYLNLQEQTDEKFLPNPFDSSSTIYRTNDIAYRLENGDFMYLGRNDTQIKIRGLRVELGEIEESIKNYPDIDHALVRVLSHETLGKLLVAYFVQNSLKKTISENELRTYLHKRLPEHMVPSYFINIPNIPMMRNGKIDYQALPNPFSSSEHFDHDQCNKIEQILIQIFAELFKMDEKSISLDHDFFALGGHSLLATQMIARIQQQLKLSLPVSKVFELRTIKKLAEYLSTLIENHSDSNSLMLTHVPENTKAPLSMAQKQMWFFYQLDKESSLYNIPFLMRFKHCNPSILAQSLYHLVKQNPNFRTVFEDGDEEPCQQILENVSFDIPIYEVEDLFNQQLTGWDQEAFDLLKFPLFRFAICAGKNETRLYFNIHHIIFDGWSLKIFINQLNQTYQALTNEKNLPCFTPAYTYADYAYSEAEWNQTHKLDNQLAFWQSFLQGVEPALNLPTDFPYPQQQNYEGEIVPLRVSKALTEKLKTIALENKTTLFSVLLTAYFILLYRYTKQSDIVIGTPIAGRYLSEIEPIMGFFVNESIYRQQLSNTKTFIELLASVHQNACDAAENQSVAFNQIIEALNINSDPKQNPLFQVMFSLQTGHQLDGKLSGTNINYHITERHQKTAKVDITLLFNEMSQGELDGFVEYRTDLFTETSIQHLCAHYTNILEAICTNAAISIAELTILSSEEIHWLVNTWPYGEKKSLSEKTVLDMIEDTVKHNGNTPALIFQNNSLTYQEFWQKVEQLASHVGAACNKDFSDSDHYSSTKNKYSSLGAGERGASEADEGVYNKYITEVDAACNEANRSLAKSIVGVFMPRGIEMIIAMCAIWKVGAAFLPLDADYPEERLQYMVQDSDTHIIISLSELRDKHAIFKDSQVNVIEADKLPEIYSKNECPELTHPTQNSLAYIIYTSGSTGQPKGVLLEHQGLSNLVQYMHDLYPLYTGMPVLQFASINFDTAMGEIFSSLSKGASLYIADNAIRQSPEILQAYIETNKIELIALPPVVLESLEQKDMPHLKVIDFGGDTCDPGTINYWKKQCRLINGYGPTETTVISSTKIYDENTAATQNIGRPLYNTEIFILDEDLNPAPTGVLGELCIGGTGLARGYLNREALTLEKFILHPFSDDPDARLYRTGDYGRWLPNGDIEFTGRIDNQVKIRGYRIEIGEIETRLNAYPNIKQVAVIAKKEQQKLIAFYTADTTIDSTELTFSLEQHLPTYMIPSTFIKLEIMPINLSGKIDRKALQNKEINDTYIHALAEPTNDMEKALISIWKEVLKTEQIGIDNSFFELGGHSLLVTQMISRVKKQLKLTLSIAKIFELRTVRKLSEYLLTLQEETKENLQLRHAPTPEKGVLSYAQKQMWFFYQLHPNLATYNIPMLFRFKNAKASLLISAFYHIIEQTPAFRTVIDNTEEDPVQVILKKLDIPFPVYDDLDRFEREIKQWDAMPFDLVNGPVLRLALAQDNNRLLVYFNIHHIAFDGWSTDILMQQIIRTYTALEQNKSLPRFAPQYNYLDYAYSQHCWLQENRLDEQLTFWQRFLQQAQTTLDLPTDFPYPAEQTFAGNSLTFSISKSLVTSLKTLANDNHTNLFSLTLAVFFALLYRYTKQEDIIIGSAISGRYHPSLESIIGFFVNESIYRQQLSNTKTFRELLASVRQNASDAADNQAIPFNEIIDKLNLPIDPKKNPLYQVFFNYTTASEHTKEYNEPIQYTIEERQSHYAKLDVTLSITECSDGSIQGEVEYRTDLFTELSIQHLCAHYQNLLQEIVQNPDASLISYRILSESEYQLLVNTWPKGETKPFPVTTVLEMIEKTVYQFPDLPALTFKGHSLTYAEFWEKVNQLTHIINITKKKTKTNNPIIGLLMPRGMEMIIAMCAIWRVGAAFLPLDAEYPEERLQYMVQDSDTHIIISLSELQHKHAMFSDITFVLADHIDSHQKDLKDLTYPTLSDLAYIIYTSGSTGNPKGVELPHQGVANLVHYLSDLYHLVPKKRALQFSSINFDAAIGEIFSGLISGSTLYIADNDIRRSVDLLQDFIQEHHIQIIFLPPAVLENLEKKPFSNIETIITGGDTCDPQVIQYWKKQCRLINAYGPTEATMCALTKLFEDDTSSPRNIGRPLYNTEAFILNEDLHPVPTGVMGELLIGGLGLARGYLNRLELTLEKFIPHPFSHDPNAKLYRTGDYARWLPNGEIEFIGRIDNQVKIRGYRIEIGEIETLLNEHPDIQQAIVIAKKEQQILIAYFVGARPITSEILWQYLSDKLPEYMIPSAFIELDKLPMNLSGKIDRKTLQAKDFRLLTQIRAFADPTNLIEKTLWKIWEEILKISQFGIDNSFFELGGHSLLITQMISRVKKQLKLNLSITKIFELKTIRKISEYLATLQEEAKENLALWHTPEPGKAPLSYAQKQMWFFYQLNPDSSTYNIPMLMRFEKANPHFLVKTFQHLIQQNPVFRTVINDTREEPIQVVLNTLNIDYPIYESLSDFYEAAEQWDKIGFDLVNGPVFKLAFAIDKADVLAYFNIHHIAFDGWSTSIMMEQVIDIYTALVKNNPLPEFHNSYEYLDYAYSQQRWLEEHRLNDQIAFWEHFLQGAQTTLDLPTDFPYPAQQNFEGNALSFFVPSDIVASLKKLALNNHTTLFTVTLSAFFVLLYRYTKQQDIIIGSPIAGRPRETLEPIIGFFVNESIYRQQLTSNKTFRELLSSVQQNALDAAENQALPFTEILNQLNIPVDPKKNPLFQVFFNYHAVDPYGNSNGHTHLQYHLEERHSNTAKLDITLSISEQADGSIHGGVEYRTDLFTELSIEHLCAHYQNLLQEIAHNPDAPLVSYNILSEQEYQFLAHEWPFGESRPLPEKTTLQLIEETVRQHAHLPAMVFHDTTLTYADFWKKVSQLAGAIHETFHATGQTHLLKNTPDKPCIIGLLMPRGIEMIIAMCAVWKAGTAYLSLDADYPEDRLLYMAQDSDTHVIITVSSLIQKQAIFQHQSIAFIHADRLSNKEDATHLFQQPQLDAPAYLLYTSGSTGNPKGVLLKHRGLSNLMPYMHDIYQLKVGMKVLQFTSINFDVSLGEIFPALTSGACLFIVDTETRRSIPHLQAFIEQQHVHIVSIPPAVLENFEKKPFSHLQTIIIIGDTCDPGTLTFWQQHCQLLNGYGPTEATVIVSSKRMTKGILSQNIGRPLYNTELFIFDEDLHPVPTGVMGELLIGGIALAHGYLNRPDLTEEKFIPHPFPKAPQAKLYRTGDYARWLPNGEIEFIGRIDNQVKIRGYRIEIGEIETLLNAYPGMKQAVVIPKKEQQLLVAYYSHRDNNTIASESLHAYLAEKLPEYMIPAAFIQLDELPVNLSGKIDRKILQAKDFRLIKRVKLLIEPRNTVESQLCEIWKEVLQTEQVGVEDSFFDLGGHSLAASRVSSRFQTRYSMVCPVPLIFKCKTIAALAEAIQGKTINTEAETNQQLMQADIERAKEILKATKLPGLRSSTPPKTILMTGAHGFLGAHLLQELLSDTQASIICIVRANSQDDLQHKLKRDLSRFNLTSLTQHPRIEWLIGDLSQPLFGLNKQNYQRLCETVDTIYHSGAWVNHILTYESLRETNVESTITFLKMAATHHAKTIHYISTTSVALAIDNLEEAGGYVQSKWVSETILQEAEKHGFKTRIFRPGNITGHSETGICVAENNHALSLIKSCIQLGIAPKWTAPTEMLPVDILSKAIVRLSLKEQITSSIFNLNNIHLLSWKDYMLYLNQLGFNIKTVSLESWKEALKNLNENNALFAFKDFYIEATENNPSGTYVQQENILAEIDLNYPDNYQALINLYWTYLKKSGFV